MATGALGPQKAVCQYPTAKVLFELFDHKIWKWIPQIVFNLLLEREPVTLNQFVECGLFGFVALVVEGLGSRQRHGDGHDVQVPSTAHLAFMANQMLLWSESRTLPVTFHLTDWQSTF